MSLLFQRARPVASRTLAIFTRPLSTTALRMAGGDTGAPRAGGERSHDSWHRREKAAEDMYIREREKQIMALLKEKIQEQEAKLALDRAILEKMEDQYGHQTEERA